MMNCKGRTQRAQRYCDDLKGIRGYFVPDVFLSFALLDFCSSEPLHFRYYGSNMGRFLKPDNILGDLTNPQSFNRYSYVKGNPVNFNDPSGHYGEDVHLDLTEVLASAGGFSEADASVIAVMDQGVDIKYSAWDSRENRELYHFTMEERREELWSAFEESGSLEALGTYLHAEQDSFSHAGYSSKSGHLEKGNAPDITSNDPAKAHLMALETYLILVKAAKIQGSNLQKVEWHKIDKLVWQFVRAKSKDEKEKILSKIKETIKEERKKKKEQLPKQPHKGKQPEKEQSVFDKGVVV